MDPRYWTFDVDRYINRAIPPPPWRHIPYPVARFLGYRREGDQPQGTGNLVPIFWAWIGVFCGVSVIEAVAAHIPSFKDHAAPIIVGSFGAAAVLEFYAIESPLAQPRNAFFGQIISAVVGVAICKLFLLSDDFESLRWLGGALACASATALMALTKTVHPPAGATALLAVTDDKIVGMGWFLLPVMMLGCVLMLSVAMLINNLMRRFPVYWWTPEDLRKGKRHEMLETKLSNHGRGAGSEKELGSAAQDDQEKKGDETDLEAGGNSSTWMSSAVSTGNDTTISETDGSEVVVRRGHVVVPEHILLTQEELLFLEELANRL
ncbi:unnamed protein product [Clonostachys rosea f. rosea IK726]|uniref:Uncharacterized protein n=1 Tax=Clonostachys rosea f. rosea IK726 TaxID=1349383 RepID=A0ACA9USE3_BIOOC|nr:unnamed protein product [Clonostachys rosea f. rosea IK726]